MERALGPYRTIAELGSGGMGTVYLAEDERGRRRAIKVIHPHLLEDPTLVSRFMREAALGMRVDHENVVRTLDVQPTSGATPTYYLVMEYVEGQTLRGLLDEVGRVPEEMCRSIGREVARGLAALHACDAVHRDLKPENLLITADHAVKIMDLGVASVADAAVHLSRTGEFVGTFLYAAPEQLAGPGARVDGRADLYALGAVLHELAAGHLPHGGHARTAARAAPVDLGLSPFLEALIATLLARHPDERFPSAEAVAETLRLGEGSAWWQARLKEHRPRGRIQVARETGVHGRAAELATLRRAYARARGGDGQVVLIRGEAGIGKTRLVDRLAEELEADGEEFDLLYGGHDPGSGGAAMNAAVAALRGHFGEREADTNLRPFTGRVPSLRPGLAALVEGRVPGPAHRLDHDALCAATVETIVAMARERPVVLVIEDLHFAHDADRAHLLALAAGIRGHRVLLLATARRRVPEEWLGRLAEYAHAGRVEPGRLADEDVTRLLESRFRSPALAEELAGRIARAADGNPLFILEIARDLRRRGLLEEQADGRWRRTGPIGTIGTPPAVADLLRARLASVPDEDRELLEIAACCGYEFEPDLVARTAGTDELSVLKAFARIERTHHLIRSAGRNCAFDHHQVQEALYAGLLQPLREHYHQRIGEALLRDAPAGRTAVDVCEHFLRTRDAQPARAAVAPALEFLEAHWDHDAMLALTSQLLERPGLLPDRERLDVLLRRARWLHHTGREDLAVFDEAASLAERLGDERAHASVERARGACLLFRGEYEAARTHLEDALDRALRCGAKDVAARARSALGNIVFFRDENLGALDDYRAAAALAVEAGAEDTELGIRSNISMVLHAAGDLAGSAAECERCVDLARRVGDRRIEFNARATLVHVAMSAGRYADALRQQREASRAARATGRSLAHCIDRHNWALLHNALGLLDEALADATEALRLAVEARLHSHRPTILVTLAEALLGRGDADGARKRCEEAIALARGQESRACETLIMLAQVEDAAGNAQAARERLEEVMRQPGSLALFQRCVVPARLAVLDEARRDELLAQALASLPNDDLHSRVEVHYLAWRARGDEESLTAARAALRELVDRAPEEHRATMQARVPLYRAVLRSKK